MELDLHTKQQLAGLLAKPETVTQAHGGMLRNLAKAYPYYQPLYLLLAKANANEHNNQTALTLAALYNQGNVLHQVIFEPKKLAPIEDLNVIVYLEDRKAKKAIEKEEISTATSDEQEVFEEIAETKTEQIAQPSTIIEEQTIEKINDEQEVFEEIAEVENSTTITEETATEEELLEEPVFVETYNFQEKNHQVQEQPTKDEEEIFDEINELDSSTFPRGFQEEISADQPIEKEEILSDLPIESIASSDFFAFEQNFNTEPKLEAEQSISTPTAVIEPEEYNQEAEAQSTVSKYDDDKLPYTFLWWLAKTRKDHEQIFQPYVTPKKHKNPTELQQQYVEHIFHLQTPFNLTEETAKGPLNNQVAKKEDEIIESFIKNDPQIRALKPDQINNENKAKKSAEDHNDLVSETLATIYIEQMLYHKAIETYEKLSLKFPEKSRYFADLIQSLEKKI